MKILVVKTSSMGDVVHTLPAVTDMAKNIPDAQIDWLVENAFSAIPRLHPAVDRVLPISWRRWRKSLFASATRAEISAARARIREQRYDLIIDFQGLVKSALWAFQAHGRKSGYAFGSARESLAPLFYARRVAVSRTLHAVERSRRLAAGLLGYRTEGPPEFGIEAPEFGWRPSRDRYAVLITGASRPEKLWPESRWLQVAHRLLDAGLGLVWLWGSQSEASRAVRLAAQSDGDVPPFLKVHDAAAVLGRAQLCVGLDTGFSHLAAAFGVPTVGIYCDHEPGLVGITGAGFVASLGGRGAAPEVAEVVAAVGAALAAASRKDH
ncbi:MAG: lipopolysaccharide heptosyltransferase I [Casimicrobiaceae bacterium]